MFNRCHHQRVSPSRSAESDLSRYKRVNPSPALAHSRALSHGVNTAANVRLLSAQLIKTESSFDFIRAILVRAEAGGGSGVASCMGGWVEEGRKRYRRRIWWMQEGRIYGVNRNKG